MIAEITIQNFKSFRQISLRLGQMNLFIGTNASGKTNFFDALRVLQGIGYGFTVHEIFDGKPKSATSIEWQPVRGGSVLARYRNGGQAEENVFLNVKLRRKNHLLPDLTYSIWLNPVTGRINDERLAEGERMIYEGAHNDASSPVLSVKYNRPTGKGKKPHWDFERSRPVLAQFAKKKPSEEDAAAAEETSEALGDMQRLDPQPELLRSYSQAQQIERMGERGENMAALVKAISQNPQKKEALMAWLQELRPDEIEDVLTLSGALGEPLFALKEQGKEFPAPVLSDGTLRFAAIAAAFLQPDMPGILTIEEIEKGIHDSRLRLVLELLKSQSRRGEVQVMATTHSRSVLNWLEEEDFRKTFHCHRDTETGESRIVPLSEVPHFNEAVRGTPLPDLFAENWLEAAV
ncbi:MAG: hypothetical protein C5B50_22460 [Verrucomicrobia bacterium]|nr:MAG: hypothetical protein C5B50_22460 [Verrucomicrobiota bacterium]